MYKKNLTLLPNHDISRHSNLERGRKSERGGLRENLILLTLLNLNVSSSVVLEIKFIPADSKF